MIIVGGKRIYGKVEQVGSTFIATTFAYLQFLPLFPTQSHIVVGEGSPGSWEVIPIKVHLKSVLAGYLRAWGIFFSMCGLIAGFFVVGDSESIESAWTGAAVAFGTAALTTAAFQLLGRVSLSEKAMRLIYARFVGHPVDVEVFDEDTRGRVATRLRRLLDEKSSSVWTATGYRQGAPADLGYRALSLEASVKDQEYLEAALTLARIEASLSVGSQRAELLRLHRKIWNKLVSVHPDVIGVVRDAQIVEGSIFRRGLGLVPLLLVTLLFGGLVHKQHETHAQREWDHLRRSLRLLDRNSVRYPMHTVANKVVRHARMKAEPDGSVVE
ncbi:hypothetical protein [Polyangium aurulentum]|uniref:hypothetical protein n=1 Tax=Polyangium aurulentum TaxID=2567896 RepID=UPI0010ADFF6E|nr:hypothetical protein [Polyangium aurulentum]UQA60862.1 hypothetical protein E8A73_010425 [Polyangium aurulentum]